MLHFFLLILAIQVSSQASITGSDDRHEVMNAPSEIREISHSIAALVRKENINFLKNGEAELSGLDYVSDLGFCQDSRFAQEQRLIANCSASLIGEDILLTAGHCVEKNGRVNLSEFVAVFDYKVENVTNGKVRVAASAVYNLVDAPLYDFDFPGDNDVAVLKLDRKVEGRKALIIEENRNFIRNGQEIFMLGFPFGLAMKYTDNGYVTKKEGMFPNSTDSFTSDLDSFSVNSGSAVFDSETRKIIGVLVRGSGANYEKDPLRGCNDWGGLVKEGEYFSEINYIDLINNFFQKGLK